MEIEFSKLMSERTEEDKEKLKNIISAFKRVQEAENVIIKEMGKKTTSLERLVDLAKQHKTLIKLLVNLHIIGKKHELIELEKIKLEKEEKKSEITNK